MPHSSTSLLGKSLHARTSQGHNMQTMESQNSNCYSYDLVKGFDNGSKARHSIQGELEDSERAERMLHWQAVELYVVM